MTSHTNIIYICIHTTLTIIQGSSYNMTPHQFPGDPNNPDPTHWIEHSYVNVHQTGNIFYWRKTT